MALKVQKNIQDNICGKNEPVKRQRAKPPPGPEMKHMAKRQLTRCNKGIDEYLPDKETA